MTDPTPMSANVTDDTLLGGKVKFRQPATGYRAAIDPVLLAASVPDTVPGRVLDLGCGAGAALLCLARRREDLTVFGLERDPTLAQLARDNAAANEFGSRVSVITGDLLQPPPSLVVGSFNAVIANPPYLDADSASPSPDAQKAAATVEGDAELADWARVAARFVRPQGLVIFIHRGDRLAELRAAMEQAGCGGLAISPIWPKAGTAPKRIVVIGRRGDKSDVRMANGLILHDNDERYTAKASAILRDGTPLTVL
ncbi:MAG TPA: methyltransferase domain-containing protein [Alphaproteobacteria bacterium]